MNNRKINSAVILCGGRGTRLGILGKKIPKCLIKVKGKPILWYIINILKINSFNHFVLPIGYKGELIKQFIKKDKNLKKLNIKIINTGVDATIAKRIHAIKKYIISDNFILLNGDAIFDFNLKKIFKKHLDSKKDMTFIGCENQLAYGTVGVINGKIVSFERNITFNSVKTKDKKNFIGYVYSGMSIFKKKILNINFKNFSNFEKSLYPKLIKKHSCDFHSFNGFWHSIDNVKDISVVNNSTDKENKVRGVNKIFQKIIKNEN
jgi:glucose-1-phosphate cytidylyltransferase